LFLDRENVVTQKIEKFFPVNGRGGTQWPQLLR
jgi:hypothetical protein